MERTFALVDCQNFYVSCQRLFRPDLWGRPVAVLSNNDGCVVARSEEVKALGVEMGAPHFKVRRRLEDAGAAVFSSCYELYGDMSRRVMSIVGRFALEQEAYSIDECFLTLPAMGWERLHALGLQLRRRAWREVGLPVRVGIGKTKTLAKLANRRAKKVGGVYALAEGGRRLERDLRRTPVGSVWGIGPAYEAKLRARGVTTALGLARVPLGWARKEMTVVGARTVLELRGVSCLPLELAPPARKSLVRSRSFGERTSRWEDLREAVATHASRAAEKLRAEGLVARGLQVFITTRGLGPGPHTSAARAAVLPRPTSYTPELVKAALELLRACYRQGERRRGGADTHPYRYKKAGVMLYDLSAVPPEQGHLFITRDPKERALMEAVDAINREMGRGTVRMASAGAQKTTGGRRGGAGETPPAWAMRQARRSPCYTTRWEHLPVALAR